MKNLTRLVVNTSDGHTFIVTWDVFDTPLHYFRIIVEAAHEEGTVEALTRSKEVMDAILDTERRVIEAG